MDDRRALDHAVLEMLGVTSSRERDHLIDRLYAYLREFFEGVRQKEEKAIGNKNKSKSKGPLSPSELASQIFADIKNNHGKFLRSYSDFIDMSQPYDTFDLQADGTPEVHEDIFAPQGAVRFMKGRKQISILPTKTREQAALLTYVAARGVRGLTRVPFRPQDCASLRKRYEAFIEDRTRRLRSMIADRTGDEDLQDRIFDALNGLILHETRG
jgi:hypothetical protein